MDVFLAQDWLTLTNSSAGALTIVQSESEWLDLAAYRDVVCWLQIKRASLTTIAIDFQTAIAREEALFTNMAEVTTASGAEVIVTPILQDLQTGGGSAAPLARWVRWTVRLPASTAEFTFRLWIAANKPGRAAPSRAGAQRR